VIFNSRAARSLRANPRRIVLPLLVLAAVALVVTSDTINESLSELFGFTSDLIRDNPVMGAVLFVALSAVAAMFMFVSSVVLVPVGIDAWGEMTCLLLLWGSWTLGGLMTYSIGRFFGRPMVERLLSAGDIRSCESRMPKSPTFLAAFAVQLVFPSDVVGYFFGLLRYPRRAYLAALMLAELPYAIATVWMGSALMQQHYLWLAIGAAVAAAIFWWQWRVRRHDVPRE